MSDQAEKQLEQIKKQGMIRVGVIGCGYWGPNLIRNFVENPHAQVVAVADFDEERLTKIRGLYPKIQCLHDYHEFYALALDAVVIATPPVTHYEITKEILNHNLHVFVEKPITQQSQQAKELIALAQQKNLTLMVGHTFEFNAGVQKLKELIETNELGEIYYVDAARLNLGLYQKGTNVLWDLAPHDISILCYILGQEPLSVIATGINCVSREMCDVVYLNLKFPKNVGAHIHVSWLDPNKVRRVTVVGSKKMVIFNDVENDKIKVVDKGVNPTVTNGGNSFADFKYSYRNGDVLIPTINFVEPLRQECQHFLSSIIHQTLPLTDGADGLRVVKILEAAQRSLENSSREEAIEADPILEKNTILADQPEFNPLPGLQGI